MMDGQWLMINLILAERLGQIRSPWALVGPRVYYQNWKLLLLFAQVDKYGFSESGLISQPGYTLL